MQRSPAGGKEQMERQSEHMIGVVMAGIVEPEAAGTAEEGLVEPVKVVAGHSSAIEEAALAAEASNQGWDKSFVAAIVVFVGLAGDAAGQSADCCSSKKSQNRLFVMHQIEAGHIDLVAFLVGSILVDWVWRACNLKKPACILGSALVLRMWLHLSQPVVVDHVADIEDFVTDTEHMEMMDGAAQHKQRIGQHRHPSVLHYQYRNSQVHHSSADLRWTDT